MVATRFAPSPTGPMHVGNARTALFNFLYARNQGGTFVLRIEDTDRQRSEKRFEDEILSDLQWLGLQWDGEVVRQSERMVLYDKYLDDLKTEGLAYEQGGAIYFRASTFQDQMKAVEFHDLVRGKISTPTKVIDDFVIVKSDGTPLFLFTNIIDDVELGITHVLRGEDHISNTPRQLMIAEALDLKPPLYGHLPMILAPDRAKLSKRHGAVSVAEYKAQGYLPQALTNFLTLLGWHQSEKFKSPASQQGGQNPKVKTEEYFSMEELMREFSLERVQRSAAVFDIEKLNSINRHYIRHLAPDQLLQYVQPISAHMGENRAYLEKIALVVKERLTRLVEFDSEAIYFFEEPNYDAKQLIFRSSDQEKTTTGLTLVTRKLENTEETDWSSPSSLQKLLADTVAETGLGNGDVFWPVRMALSGKDQSPGPHELLWAMGQERSLARLNQAIKMLS